MQYIRQPHQMFQVTVKEAEGFGEPPAIFPLAEFKEALTKKMRGVKFAGRGQNSVHVYYPHEKFTRGLISVHDGNYRVRSRFIRNERYSRDLSPEYYMQWSKNLSTAVKKAAAALVEWSALEMSTLHARAYDKGRSDLIYTSSQKRIEALADLGVIGHSPALATLQSMLHQITDLDVKSKVEEVLRREKENAELESVGASPTFVHVCQDYRGRQTLETQKIDRIYYSCGS